LKKKQKNCGETSPVLEKRGDENARRKTGAPALSTTAETPHDIKIILISSLVNKKFNYRRVEDWGKKMRSGN